MYPEDMEIDMEQVYGMSQEEYEEYMLSFDRFDDEKEDSRE